MRVGSNIITSSFDVHGICMAQELTHSAIWSHSSFLKFSLLGVGAVCGRIFWSLVVNSFKEAVGLRLASTPICELEMSGLLTIKLCIEPETAYWVCIIHVN